jgi:hypothetical protein
VNRRLSRRSHVRLPRREDTRRAKASYDAIERKPTTRRPEFAVAAPSAELLTKRFLAISERPRARRRPGRTVSAPTVAVAFWRKGDMFDGCGSMGLSGRGVVALFASAALGWPLETALHVLVVE